MQTDIKKLNLGSGDKPLEGYLNLDIKNGHQIYPLKPPFRFGHFPERTYGTDKDELKGSIEEIRASHVLEHFPYEMTLSVLQDWVSYLKPGGIMKIAVPDFKKLAMEYIGQPSGVGILKPMALRHMEAFIMGGQSDGGDFHKALFDEPGLKGLMKQAGLVNIRTWTSEINDCARLPISLNLQGEKPNGTLGPAEHKQRVKIAAVMSVPRLSITNNVASMYRTIAACGLPCQPAQGVFWHHALTRQIEDRIADGFEYLLAVDFDSWFLPGHVERLVELLLATPEADAICAVQCEREGALPIMGIHDELGKPLTALPRADFRYPLTRIHIGHFGLTLFRAAVFGKISKPWFRDEPDPQGSYREGRRDADVAFWNKFEAEGRAIYMANEVTIGHLQEICTFAGPAETNWRPVHVYLKDLNAGRLPDHCRPEFRISQKS